MFTLLIIDSINYVGLRDRYRTKRLLDCCLVEALEVRQCGQNSDPGHVRRPSRPLRRKLIPLFPILALSLLESGHNLLLNYVPRINKNV
ncbi:GSCOCG00003382001-RA-CDS [Cotesia congregata]|nr:GSCOCG00003382001-RA-CDS [Cotesia congregata]